jgi:UDP-N-acetylmuramate dehydrogenase
MEYCGQYNLKNHSTLKIGPVNAKVVYIDKKEDIEPALEMAKKLNLAPYPLGGGSNTIFSDQVVDKYLFLIPRMKQLHVIPNPSVIPSSLSFPRRRESMDSHLHENDNAGEDDNSKYTLVQISAGLEWDKAVEQTVEMGLSGLEALSWIPGLVGASPVQNIGAYGAEAKDTIHTVHTFDMKEKKYVDFNNKDCEFEYRNSIFKKNPGKFFIYSVTFSLSKTPPSVPQYKDVISYFESRKISSPTLKEIREAIIEIRKAKLPNPAETPNAGSYFGNPIVSKETAAQLLEKFLEMPMFDFDPPPSIILSPLSFPRRRESMDPRIRKDDKQEYKKLFAGWLIDKAGLKGYSNGNFSIHKNHALVIIGNGKGSLSELLEFENYIKQKVFDMFKVEPEREPVVVE